MGTEETSASRQVGLWIKENKFLMVFVLVYAFILTMPNEFFFASSRMQNYDQAIYQYIGYLVTKGQMPYVDAFDHKGPLVYLIYAVSCLINMKWGAWLINFIFMTAMLGISYCIAHCFVSRAWSVIINLILYSGFIILDFRGGTPEFFAGLFMAASLYYLIEHYFTQNISNVHLLMLGACNACIFWLKHSTLVTIILLCAFIVIELLIKKKFSLIGRYIFLYTVGFFSVSIIVCGWLFINHAMEKMIEDYFVANLLYAGNTTLLNRVESFLYLSSHPSVVIVWILLFVYIFFKIIRKRKGQSGEGRLILHTAIALMLSLLFLAMPGRNYYHYLSTLFPLLVLMMACILKTFFSLKMKNQFFIRTFSLIATVCLFVYPNFRQLYSACVNTWTEDYSKTQLVNTINQYTSEKGEISILGGSAGLYLASGHDSATSYPYIASAVLNDPKRGEDYKEQIKSNRPEVIISEPRQNEYQVLGYDILKNYYLMEVLDSQKIYVRKDMVQISSVADELKSVIDLETYLSLLSRANDYTILFAVKDTQGNKLNEQLIAQLEYLGFENLDALLENENHTFAGIIEEGKVMFQQMGAEDEAILYEAEMNGDFIQLESKTYQYGNLASIQINNTEYALNKRGWNIVVYDHSMHEVVDTVVFDTHDANYICYR